MFVVQSSVKPFLLQETSVLERKTEITSVSVSTKLEREKFLCLVSGSEIWYFVGHY